MKKQLLLSTLLGAVAAFSLAQGAFAANNASQIITGSLAATKAITVKSGQSTTTSIAPSSGVLAAQLTPGFTLNDNEAIGALTLTATVDTGAATPCFGVGTDTFNYIALGNTTTKPSASDVANAIAADIDLNPNVIAYKIAAPAVTKISGSGSLTAFAYGSNKWTSTGGDAGVYDVIITSDAAKAARTGTFDSTDLVGNYAANLTLTFDS